MTDPVLGIDNFDSKGVTTETFGGVGTCEVKVVQGSVIFTSESACQTDEIYNQPAAP